MRLVAALVASDRGGLLHPLGGARAVFSSPCAALEPECGRCDAPGPKETCNTAVASNDDVQCTVALEDPGVHRRRASVTRAPTAEARRPLPYPHAGRRRRRTPDARAPHRVPARRRATRAAAPCSVSTARPARPRARAAAASSTARAARRAPTRARAAGVPSSARRTPCAAIPAQPTRPIRASAPEARLGAHHRGRDVDIGLALGRRGRPLPRRPRDSRVEVVVVLWGDVDGALAGSLGPFYTTVTGGAYFDWLGEYDTAGATVAPGGEGTGTRQHVNRGSYATTVHIAPAAGSGDFLDSDVRAELANDVSDGALPAPRVDPEGGVDTLYMVYFPPGASIVGPGASGISCAQYCAYHDTFAVGGLSVPYGVVPDMSAGGCTECGPGSALDRVTKNSSHELAEAVTDPESHTASGTGGGGLAAWYDDANGEIADVCDGPGDTATQGGFTVQLLWSQRKRACIAEDPDLPVCGACVRAVPARPTTAREPRLCAIPRRTRAPSPRGRTALSAPDARRRPRTPEAPSPVGSSSPRSQPGGGAGAASAERGAVRLGYPGATWPRNVEAPIASASPASR